MAETDDPLERFFAAGRATRAEPSDALMRRVEADALRELERRKVAPPVQGASGTGWRGILAALGGWRAGAGLATAAATGLALGVTLPSSSPSSIDALLSSAESYEIGDLAPGYGLALLEGE